MSTAPRPPTPPAETCGSCGTVCDDWVWDEQDQEWENDFEWLAVHREHCGGDGPCIGNANDDVSTNG